MGILFWVISVGFFFGLYHFCIKLASGHIHDIMGALILQAVATLLGIAAFLFLKFQQTPLPFSSKGITFSILAGLFVGLAEIFSFIVFSKGVSVSTGTPLIIGTTLLTGSALGFFILKETISSLQFLGIALTLAGVLLLTFTQVKA